MKTDCGIIRDLLPLYTENLCREESKKAVEEHLLNCPDCKAQLDIFQKESKLTPLEAAPIKSLTKKLRGKHRKLMILAVVLVLFLSTVAFHHLTEKHYLEYAPDLIDVIPTADGSGLVISPKTGINAVLEVQSYPSPEEVPSYPSPEFEGFAEYHISMYKSGGAFHQNQTNLITLKDDVKTRVYYIAPNKTAIPLYGEKAHDNFIVLPRLSLNYYFMFAGALLIIMGVIWFLLKILPSTRTLLSPFTWLTIAALPLAYMISHLAIKGFNSTSWDLISDLQHILIAAFFAYIFIVLGINCLTERKKVQSTPV